jgi:uncharacterized protein (DUF2342 family)
VGGNARETHRVQFTAVPWLREHMIERSRTLALELAPTPSEFAERIQQIAQGLPGAFRPGSTGLAEVFLTPEQKGKIAEITAVMSLLEGHADVIMDDVGRRSSHGRRDPRSSPNAAPASGNSTG